MNKVKVESILQNVRNETKKGGMYQKEKIRKKEYT